MNVHHTLTGAVADQLACDGIHLVVSASPRSSGDVWCDAVDQARSAGKGRRTALIHLNNGSWDGGYPRYRDDRGRWHLAEILLVGYGLDDRQGAQTILATLRSNGFNASWSGDLTFSIEIYLNTDDAKRATFPRTAADLLRAAHEYAETHVTHSHTAMLTAADELDRLAAQVADLDHSLTDLEHAVVQDASRRAGELERARRDGRADGERDALRELHKRLTEVMRDSGRVKDFAQAVDDYFVEKGLGTVLYE